MEHGLDVTAATLKVAKLVLDVAYNALKQGRGGEGEGEGGGMGGREEEGREGRGASRGIEGKTDMG